MTRLATWGAEGGHQAVDLLTATTPSGGTVGVSATTKRSGDYAFITATAGTSGAAYLQTPITGSSQLPQPASGTTVFFRLWLYIEAYPASTVGIIEYGVVASSVAFQIRMDSSGVLRVYNGAGTVQGSVAPSALSLNTWHSIEIAFTFQSAANDTVDWSLNGTSVESITAAFLTTAFNMQMRFGWLAAPGTNKRLYWDDGALNDSTGSNENAAPARDGKIVALLPASISNRASWTGGAGGTTLSDMVTAISTRPPAGTATETNTSQIESAVNAANNILDVLTGTYTAAGIGASDTIKLVVPVAVHGEDINTGSKDGSFYLSANPTSAGVSQTFVFGNDVGALGTFPSNWATIVGASTIEYNPSVTLGTGATILFNEKTTDTRVASCCFLAVMVEYVPYNTGVWSSAKAFTGRLWALDDLPTDPEIFYDSTDIVGLSNADPVSQWDDSSGLGNHIAMTGSARPTYRTAVQNGLPIVRFDGTQYLFRSGFTITNGQPYTIFSLHKSTQGNSGSVTFVDGSNGFDMRHGNGSFDVWAGTTANYVAANLNFNSHIFVVNGASTLISFNGTTGTFDLGSGAPPDTAGLWMGTESSVFYFGIYDWGMWGYIPGALPEADRLKLEGFLHAMWGLLSSLPSNHPFKADPPRQDHTITAEVEAGDVTATWGTATATTSNTTIQGSPTRVPASAAVATTSTASCSARVRRRVSAVVSSVATATPSARKRLRASAVVSIITITTSSGVIKKRASVAPAAVATAIPSGRIKARGIAVSTASSLVSPSGQVRRRVSAATAATSNATASGRVRRRVAASTSAVATVTISGQVRRRVSSTASATATITANSRIKARGVTTAVTVANITAIGTVTAGGVTHQASATSATTAIATISGQVRRRVSAVSGASATAIPSGRVRRRATAATSTVATVTATGQKRLRAQLITTATTTASSTARVRRRTGATVAAQAVAFAPARLRVRNSILIQAQSTITSTARVKLRGMVSAQAASSITPSSRVKYRAQSTIITVSNAIGYPTSEAKQGSASCVATASVTANARVRRRVSASTSATASATVSGRRRVRGQLQSSALTSVSASPQARLRGNAASISVTTVIPNQQVRFRATAATAIQSLASSSGRRRLEGTSLVETFSGATSSGQIIRRGSASIVSFLTVLANAEVAYGVQPIEHPSSVLLIGLARDLTLIGTARDLELLGITRSLEFSGVERSLALLGVPRPILKGAP